MLLNCKWILFFSGLTWLLTFWGQEEKIQSQQTLVECSVRGLVQSQSMCLVENDYLLPRDISILHLFSICLLTLWPTAPITHCPLRGNLQPAGYLCKMSLNSLKRDFLCYILFFIRCCCQRQTINKKYLCTCYYNLTYKLYNEGKKALH